MVFLFHKNVLNFNKKAVADKPVMAFLCIHKTILNFNKSILTFHKTILTFNEKKGCECK